MEQIIIILSIILVITVISLMASAPSFRSAHHKSSILKQYAKDLTKLAELDALDPVIGREREIIKLIQILSRRKKNNPILVGRAGVGKTAIVEGLARAIVKGGVPQTLLGKHVLSLDLTGLVAGTKYRGEFEKRFKALTDEIINSDRNFILFIDEIHTLAEAGEASGAIDAEDILKPALSGGDLQLIGATTFDEYHKFIEPNLTLARRFQPIIIDEPNPEETLLILRGLRPRYEKFHHVIISDTALQYIISKSDSYEAGRVMPDKAIDLLDETSSKVKLAKVTNPEKYGDSLPEVRPEDVDQVITEWRDNQQAEKSLGNAIG